MVERRVPTTDKVITMIGAGGGGDMMKAIYDTNANNIVDNSEKLEGSTKAQVQDHTPKAHTLASHSTKAHSELTDVTADQHHAQAHTLASHSTRAHSELSDAPENAHHTKFTTTEHAAIGDGAPHHAKYTDGEAVTAAKTVKLDELATPDDNTTLNASTSRHGLLKKLDNVATNFLNGQGGWSVPAGGNGGASTTSGQYTGDGTVNRAITHGLGVVPKYIVMWTKSIFCAELGDNPASVYTSRGTTDDPLAVTAMTTELFYVGNATNYAYSANVNEYVYYWFAIG